MTRFKSALAAIALMLGSAAPVLADETRAEETRLEAVGEDAIVARDGDVYLASQPSLADADAWAARGVGTVVNLRSTAENESLPFDEAAEFAARGINYTEIPMGGADGYAPPMRDLLTEVLRAAEGPVVLHCRSGVRAANAYAAHLLAEEGLSVEALDDFGWPGGLSENMLGELAP